ncbi:uncharacterized protein A1O9_06667 [Exophiala aquamarina CBS 119918]|uniref:DJ-1/PfpI domain-containing protein n=1 Tax=Exophiala aquamarina CBS 119918 TaxID=1182545 RepID=A0A072PFX4_9EURO|nr:uncharacterized protein A1O9_06667 [Exophiala aquamarina CBS 119918]KEF58741.1 hypothetical protein A1O9_06667 [Exophiala aquamarina CBS 119918]
MGAHNVNYKPNEKKLAYVRKAYEEATVFVTICGGIQSALEARVLKGKSAIAPRVLLPMAQQLSPDTEWYEKRWHRDGKLWTSGALLNEVDLRYAFVNEIWVGKGSLI